MRRYIIKRLLQLIPILFGVTFLTFGLMFLAGGDAVSAVYENTGTVVSDEILAAQRAKLGLDQPFLVQYFRWLGGFLTGHMGVSYISGKDVYGSLISRLPATLLLTGVSMLMTICISFPLGILAAVKQNRITDGIIRVLAGIGNSMPNFFVAMLLMYWLSICIPVFPVMATGVNAKSLFLPALTLAIAMSAKYVRQIRAVVLDELQKPYVTGARSRGVRESVILWGNVIRISMLTVLTLLALSVGSLLGGTAIVENIFSWDGVGRLAMNAITMRDYPIILAYVVWMSLVYVLVNLATDILYHFLDPRIRLNEADAGGLSKKKRHLQKASGPDSEFPATEKQEEMCFAEAKQEQLEGPEAGQEQMQSAEAGHMRAEPDEWAPREFQEAGEKPDAGIRVRSVRVRKNRTKQKFIFFSVLLLILVLVSIFADQICPWDPYEQNLQEALQAPSTRHIFGTDSFGRDLFSRVIMGSRASLSSALTLVAGILVIGTCVGSVAGWRGGKIDALLMRIADVFLSFPEMVFALAIAGVLGGGTWNAVLALMLIGWPKYARLVRSLVLSQKGSLYVDAARMSGSSGARIFFTHILPNIAGPVLVTAVSDIGAMMMELAGLSFLGLGTMPPTPEWGSMMSDARSLLQTVPWVTLAPGLGIFVTVMIFHLFGDALRDRLDPKSYGR